MPKVLYFVVFLVLVTFSANSLAAKFPVSGAEFLNTCRQATAKTEKTYRLPKRLLNAISLTETGRWHAEKREIIAWPWTVYSEGRGRYLPSKRAAIAEVLKLKAKGVKNIDVGCMQVNLYWHPEAFSSLEDAFDPAINTDYAGKLLKKLQKSSRSWNVAIAYYHSQTKKYYIPYRKKVMKIWQEERNRDTKARMAKAREKYRVRREALRKKMEAVQLRNIAQAKTPGKG